MTPEEIAQKIAARFFSFDQQRQDALALLIAAALRTYGDARAAAERDKIAAIINNWQPTGRASDMEALIAAIRELS